MKYFGVKSFSPGVQVWRELVEKTENVLPLPWVMKEGKGEMRGDLGTA